MPVLLPPEVERLVVLDELPGQRSNSTAHRPDPDAIRAMDPQRSTPWPMLTSAARRGARRITSQQDAEATIADFYAELRRSSRLLKVWNGANRATLKRLEVTLLNSDGGTRRASGSGSSHRDTLRMR
jgi:hypothetical protein